MPRPRLTKIFALCVAIAVALPVMGMVDPPEADAALVPQDCFLVDDPIGGADLPVAADDDKITISQPGQVDVIRPLFQTQWNKTLEVLAPGVLANDVAEDIFNNPASGVLRAIRFTLPDYGFVRVNEDGSFSYSPNPAFANQDRIDTFQYVAYDTRSKLCSEPATVSVYVSGFDLGLPPGGAPDAYPATGPGLSAADGLRVDSPGVLANDLAGLDPGVNPGAGLEARLWSQPVWEGTDVSAGAITGWGTRVDLQTGLTLTDNSGGFTYNPSENRFGTAVFSYRACYRNRATSDAACSTPIPVRIRVALTAVAKPITVVAQPGNAGAFFATVLFEELLANSVFNGPVSGQLSVRLGAPAHGTASVLRVRDVPLAGPDRDPDEVLGVGYDSGSTFAGTDEFTYRLCDTAEDTPQTVCTNDATIKVITPPAASSSVAPTTVTGNVDVRFNRTVRGLSTANTTLVDVTDPGSPTSVPVQLRCYVEIVQKDLAGLPRIGPDGKVVVEEQVQSCSSGTASLVRIDPVDSLVAGRSYELSLNSAATGIVSTDERALAMPPYKQSFTVPVPDTAAPTAAPTATAPADTWSNDDVIVTWNWSDGSGSGVDPNRCTTSSVSSGEGPQALTATCTDRANNVGTAAYEVKVDRTPPEAAPSFALVNGAAGPTEAEVIWNWTDVNGSGIDASRCPASSRVPASSLRSLAESCTDVAGNVGTAGLVGVQSDTSAPTARPTASAAGWSNTDVTVQWNWTDGGGAGLDPAACPASTTSTGEGVLTLSASCTDLAGNVGSASAEIRVDRTPPAMAPVVSPNPVWLNGSAAAQPNATDGGSGVAGASCAAVDTSELGARTVRCTATDLVGNSASVDTAYRVDVGLRWVRRPLSIQRRAGARIVASVRLLGSDGRPIPANVAAALPPCSVTFHLGQQAPVCARFRRGNFEATITSQNRQQRGATVPLFVLVSTESTPVGIAGTQLVVK